MSRIGDPYAAEVSRLAKSATTTEPSFYPAIKSLLSGVLAKRGLYFDVRIKTSERREGGGTGRGALRRRRPVPRGLR
jgi:hypothetical protein